MRKKRLRMRSYTAVGYRDSSHLIVLCSCIMSPVPHMSYISTLPYTKYKTLKSKFAISRADARKVVLDCQHCVQFHHPPSIGVNPWGLLPLRVWQMDVMHISEFGRLKYVHVSVNTCSGVMFASPMTGEKSSNVITHCLEAWAAWGKPQQLKTDNGPAYSDQKFKFFCAQMDVQLVHGLPYNPQGQGIVERAHRSLKELLLKQKGGIGSSRAPKDRLSLALFTFNFLNLDVDSRSVADRHAAPSPSYKGQNQQDPIWVPERLVRKVTQNCQDEDASMDDGVPPDPESHSRAKTGNTISFSEANAN
ncbi:hypothetical protein STEG23_038406 [Scotinomys teguina]